MAVAVLEFIGIFLKMVVVLPLLRRFLAGDKEKKETLWYGMATLIFVIAFK